MSLPVDNGRILDTGISNSATNANDLHNMIDDIILHMITATSLLVMINGSNYK